MSFVQSVTFVNHKGRVRSTTWGMYNML